MCDNRIKDYTHRNAHKTMESLDRQLSLPHQNYEGKPVIALCCHCNSYHLHSTTYFHIHHLAYFLIHVFSCSDFLLHNSDWVLLMRETVNLCGGSAHTLMQSHMQAAGLRIYLKLYTLPRRIIYICGFEKYILTVQVCSLLSE